jgi:Uma2 family endonuclease
MSTTVHKLITAEEFLQMPDNDMKLELVKGEVIESMPPGGEHGVVAAEVFAQLRMWMKKGYGGCAGIESGVILARHPDTVRGPDVYYFSQERIPETGIPKAFWQIAPDLAVEVVSPYDTVKELGDKVRDYLDAGTPIVWVVYPERKEVVVYTQGGTVRVYQTGDVLEGFKEVLPGFRCPVAELF